MITLINSFKIYFLYSKENTEAIIIAASLTHSDLAIDLKSRSWKNAVTVTNLDLFPERLDIDGNKISYHDLSLATSMFLLNGKSYCLYL